MIPAKHFYMIRHGQSVANAQETMAGGGHDAELTDLGRQQARATHAIFKNLSIKPADIVHSHMIRARDTAAIINECLGLPMHEHPDLFEHHVGEWEGMKWKDVHPLLDKNLDPPGGEPHQEFHARIKRALTAALEPRDKPPLIVCHGGIFRGMGKLYGANFQGILNCVLYEFVPTDAPLPWTIYRHDETGRYQADWAIESQILRA
jgi:broad specificity phosphatase PhoE